MNGNSSAAFGWNGVDLLARAVRRNPEGLLLLGAGVVLLLRSGGTGLKPMTRTEGSASGPEHVRRAEEGMVADGGLGRMSEQGRARNRPRQPERLGIAPAPACNRREKPRAPT